MKLIRLFTFLIGLTLTQTVVAQKEEDEIPDFKKPSASSRSKVYNEDAFFKLENVVIGAGFNLSFSSNLAYIGISPSVGYRLLEPLEFGINTGYSFLGGFGSTSYSQHQLSIGPYLKVYPVKDYFIQIEGEVSHIIVKGGGTYGYGNALVGIGYNSFIGDRSYISAGIKMNLVENALYYNSRIFLPFFSFYWRLNKPKN